MSTTPSNPAQRSQPTTDDTAETVAAELAYFEAHAERFADAHKGIVDAIRAALQSEKTP